MRKGPQCRMGRRGVHRSSSAGRFISLMARMNSVAEDKGTLSELDRSQDRRSPCASQLPGGAKRARPFPHWVVIFTAAAPRQARGSWGGSQDSLKSRYLTAKHGCDASQRGISVQRSPLSQCERGGWPCPAGLLLRLAVRIKFPPLWPQVRGPRNPPACL